MIKIEVDKILSLIRLFNTESSKTYVNFHVDGKYNSFAYFRLLYLDEILNSKSISIEHIKKKILS